jgi:uncharacterized membrane protein YsdA (DUF1294 family)
MDLFLIYLLLINALGFLLMLADKRSAKKKLWRVPETTLLGIAVIGGSLGILLGMYFARHKTKHLKFAIGVPAIFAAQVVLAVILYSK